MRHVSCFLIVLVQMKRKQLRLRLRLRAGNASVKQLRSLNVFNIIDKQPISPACVLHSRRRRMERAKYTSVGQRPME